MQVLDITYTQKQGPASVQQNYSINTSFLQHRAEECHRALARSMTSIAHLVTVDVTVAALSSNIFGLAVFNTVFPIYLSDQCTSVCDIQCAI